ncbi:MAG: ABC transporter permease [Elusimicrobia bacterium]|nr:ABC transporter permease [Elusimicrobiota bacterium]
MKGLGPLKIALREVRYRPIYAALFVLSMAVGTASLMALAGVSGVVRKTLTSQAKELWSADITVKGSEGVLDDLEKWAKGRWPGLRGARSIDTLSMAQHRASRKTAQVTLSAISSEYPLYGTITTGSGRPFHAALRPGSIVVGDRLLKGWNLAVGDSLRIGALDLTIADTVVERTDVPTSFFELSPTVFLTLDDLRDSQLMSPGSRASNTLSLNLPPETDLAKALAEVKARAASETTEVASWATDNPGILKFIQTILLYLQFLALLTLTLGGIGTATALSAALNAGQKSLGMIFALGAPRGFVYRIWGWWVALLSALGLGAALLLGRVLSGRLLSLFGDLLPRGLLPAFPAAALLQAAGVGLGAGFLFTLLPLLKLGDIAPNVILSDDVPAFPARRLRTAGVLAFGVGGFFLLAWAQTGHAHPAFQYVGILALLIFVGGGFVALAMGGLRRGLSRFTWTLPRLAARGLARPGNLNDAVVLSVTLSLTVILTLFLLERNLFSQMIESFPPDAPNAFFINIQPTQAPLFRQLLDKPAARLFPLVRGRVVAVNDTPVQEINRRGDRGGRGGDRLTREFGFTYGEDLLPTDTVVEGPGLWDPRIDGPQVSVFENYKKRFGLRRGDRLTVSLLGRRFTATVSSFRAINQSVRQPFFYFYFRPGLLEEVPHTLMTGLALPRDRLPNLQNELAEALPNVTVVDLSDVAALTGRLFHRLGRIVRVLGFFGLSSGILLLLSSLLASLASRTKESALFRVLGASRRQIVGVALLEYTLIAGTGALAALALGTAASALLLRRVFELRLELFPAPTGLILGAAAGGMVLLSWAMTRSAFLAPPMEALRHE